MFFKMKVLLTICLLMSVGGAATAQQSTKLTRSQTKEAEQRLSELGYWTGPVDGIFDPGSRAALTAFQKYEGRSITGRLTIEELEVIRNSAAPQPRDTGYPHVEVDLDRQVLLIVGNVAESAGNAAHSKDSPVRVLPVSTGNDREFMSDGQKSIAYTPRGRFVVYDKSFGWENGQLGSVYYANYITGGVAIHGYLSVPKGPASHGCIRIPMFAAREVSKLLKLGTIVLVYDKVSFVSAKEWIDNPKLKEAAMLNSAAGDYVDEKTKTRRTGPRVIRS